MNTSKDTLNLIELSNLLNKIELQIQNIEVGDTHTEIDILMNFPFKSKVDNSYLRNDAMKELHEMLYKAFVLISQISIETNNADLPSIVNKSCSRIIVLLSSCQLKMQKAPMVKPLADLYKEAIINLQRNNNDSLISSFKNLANTLFV